jgi:hypothetical protein
MLNAFGPHRSINGKFTTVKSNRQYVDIHSTIPGPLKTDGLKRGWRNALTKVRRQHILSMILLNGLQVTSRDISSTDLVCAGDLITLIKQSVYVQAFSPGAAVHLEGCSFRVRICPYLFVFFCLFKAMGK